MRCACHEKCFSSLSSRHPKLLLFLAFGMISTASTLTHFLQNRRFTWDVSQKRSFWSNLATANPNVTARANTSKTPLWNCKPQCNYDANASLSRNPAPVQRNASPFLLAIPLLRKPQWKATQTDTWHIREKSLFRAPPNGRAIGAGFEHLRTVEDGCGHENNGGRTQLDPQTPKLNENPSLRIRGAIQKNFLSTSKHPALKDDKSLLEPTNPHAVTVCRAEYTETNADVKIVVLSLRRWLAQSSRSSRVSCRVPLKNPLAWLLDTLSWHSFAGRPRLTLLQGTLESALLLDTLSPTLLFDTLSWHSSWALLPDTLCLTLFLDTLAGHSCWTLLPDAFAWHFCCTLFLDTLCQALFLDTLAWHPFWTNVFDPLARALLLDTLAWHSCKTLLTGHPC